MTSRLRLATPVQLAVMTLGWLALCVAIDLTFNPRVSALDAEPPPESPLSLHFHHLRCNGCTEEITGALRKLPWLRDASMTVRAGGADTVAGNFAGWLDIGGTDPAQMDFIAVDQTLRQAGFVASHMLFGGYRHFRLEGKAHHLCPPTAATDCEPLPDVGTVRRGNRLQWLDSMGIDTSGSLVTFHVRFQRPEDRIDVKELFAAMDEYGMLTYTLRPVLTVE